MPSRRSFLRCGVVSGLTAAAVRAADGGDQSPPHRAARAKRVIFLFMHGGPSHVDTFDYKPELQRRDGEALPFDLPAEISARPVLMRSPWRFAQHGESGRWVSELLPHTAAVIDELAILNGVHSRGQSHGQAVSMLHTGSDNLVRPSVGAWVSYGLGAETDAMPPFVSLAPAISHGGPRNYGAAFLPARHQATAIGKNGTYDERGIAHLQTPPDFGGVGVAEKRVRFLQQLNRTHLDRVGGDPHVAGAIEAIDLATRMQQVAPSVMDLSRESAAMRSLYGLDDKATANFGRQCLLARRLAEAGVRFIELSTGNVWDQHGNLKAGHEKNALATDRPIAGLLRDLRQRGLLDDTLVVWGGEFGRTPVVQGKNGRDHNPQGFTMWMAGGGVRPGVSYGQTDEFGYHAEEDRTHMHDVHATILHLLGLDHTRLTYRYAGRDFRLTDVAGHIVEPILQG